MSTNTDQSDQSNGIYLYKPSRVLPAVFAVLVGTSLILHIYQNLFWKVTFFMFWAGTVFTSGWIMRCISASNPSNLNFYIAQYVLILAGPPIYSAAEYNVLGRLLRYVPMHSPLHPGRLLYFFIYIGAAVESLTAAGASMIASSHGDIAQRRTAGILISVSLVLQGAVECVFMFMVAMIHRRCIRSNMLSRNIKMLCIMLYGTSTLILFRCIARAVESFGTEAVTTCGEICRTVLFHEWYLYVFEAAPMVVYTYWINIVHPGRLLPRNGDRYLDVDGETEHLGPGWIDKRSKLETFYDLFDISGILKGQPNHEKFWLQPGKWPVATDGSFALNTASNVPKRGTGVPVEDKS